jgi:hypothetical protein
MLMSAVAIAAPALAQTSAPASTAPAQPAATPAATAAQPATAATPSTSAQQPTTAATPEAGATSAPAAAATPATNSSDAVAAVVSADWAKYDADNDGKLSKAEFGAWMTALREQNPAQKAAVKDPEAWTTAAFAMADKDKSGAVSKTELEGFLKG